jgi:transglycosylase-like protein with SLT domain
MGGLLDFLDFPTWTTGGINPAAPIPGLMDPEELQRQKLRQQLIALGTGLASGKNWQEGAARGLQGFSQAGSQVEEDMYRKGILGMQYQQMKKSLEPSPGWRTLTPQEAQAMGYPPDRQWQIGPDNKIEEAYKPDKPEKTTPIFQDWLAPNGIKIPRVSYDNGMTWMDMTTGGQPQPAGGGMDPMQAIVQMESGGNPNAVSPKTDTGYAYGLTQMQPGAFNEMAGQAGIPGQLRNQFNPQQSMAMGSRYLGQQEQAFGDPVLAAGAYHAGPGNFKAYLAKAGYQPGMPMDQLIGKMETFAPKTAQYMRDFAGKTWAGSTQSSDYSIYAKEDQPMATITTDSGETITIGGKGMKPLQAATTQALKEGETNYNQAKEMLSIMKVAKEAAKRFPASGIAGKFALGGSRVLNFLGLPNNAPAGEILQALNSKLATLTRLPGSGSTSDYEFAAYAQSAPGLMNTPEGNQAMVEIGSRLLEKRMRDFERYRDYVAAHDGTDVGYVADDKPVLSEKDFDLLFGSEATANAPSPTAEGVDDLLNKPPEQWTAEDRARAKKALGQ